MTDRCWTDDRCGELRMLEVLLAECVALDRATSVIERMQKIIAIAEKLTATDFARPRDSFRDFLRKLAIEDRQ